MGGTIPKMLLPLRGKPILHWTLQFLELCPFIDNIVLTSPPGLEAVFKKKIILSKFKKIHAVVPGGAERTDSTRNALQALPQATKWVGIHDAARPFVTSENLKEVFSAAKSTGCAVLAVPSKDTVKVAGKSGKFIKSTIPRKLCWLAQTPQVFRRDIAEKLHSKSRTAQFTDDASIAESLGYQVALVMGSYENIKITTWDDLPTAEKILKKRLKNG